VLVILPAVYAQSGWPKYRDLGNIRYSTLDQIKPSPTQPFPAKPPPARRLSITRDQLAKVTPE
jgi:hypothetical protein